MRFATFRSVKNGGRCHAFFHLNESRAFSLSSSSPMSSMIHFCELVHIKGRQCGSGGGYIYDRSCKISRTVEQHVLKNNNPFWGMGRLAASIFFGDDFNPSAEIITWRR